MEKAAPAQGDSKEQGKVGKDKEGAKEGDKADAAKEEAKKATGATRIARQITVERFRLSNWTLNEVSICWLIIQRIPKLYGKNCQ